MVVIGSLNGPMPSRGDWQEESIDQTEGGIRSFAMSMFENMQHTKATWFCGLPSLLSNEGIE